MHRDDRYIDKRQSISGAAMSRVQLALNVADLDQAIGFYTKLFGTAPAKVRPGYANFAVANPPLKLILIAGDGEPAASTTWGSRSNRRSRSQRSSSGWREGLPTATEDEVACCYAVQDKVWVDAPDGEPWEIYTVLDDVEMPGGELRTVEARDRRDALRISARIGDALRLTSRSSAYSRRHDRPRPPARSGTGSAELDLTRRLVAEALGTGLLVIAVIGSGIMASRLSPHDRVCSCSRTRCHCRGADRPHPHLRRGLRSAPQPGS